MTRKQYIGKKLKPPFDGPQFTMVPNPDKKEKVSLMDAWIKFLKHELSDVNDTEQLNDIHQYLGQLLWQAEQNEGKPDEVKKWLWTGSIQHEEIKCGKKGCKCEKGQLHGPYYYHYPNPTHS